MKAFLEEYGLTLVAIIVVVLVLTLTIYFGASAKSQLTRIFDAFNDRAYSTVVGSSNTSN